MKWLTRGAAILIAIIAGALVAAALLQGRDGQTQARLLADDTVPTGFDRADGPREFSFPRDYGPHPGYQTEWWYYTGNLETADGRHFGYQLTFFRRALEPASDAAERPSAWATSQVYMGHLALTDVAGGDFIATERFGRGAAGLAGAQTDPYRVWLEDWSAEQESQDVTRLHAAAEGIELDLHLREAKGPALQGDEGYSQKGPEPGDASYYYSLTHLETSGTITASGESFVVEGLSWMDHEFSTSALSAGQVGWNWFSLQLDDGGEVMLYQIRHADGSIDPLSAGSIIALDGAVTPLHAAAGDYTIEVLDTWRSPHSGADYPARWRITIPVQGLTLTVEPWLADQELNVSYAYWEGAVRLSGEREGRSVSGNGYVELTGYAASMEGEF